MKKSFLLFTSLLLIISCKNIKTEKLSDSEENTEYKFTYFNPKGNTIIERYNLPKDFNRTKYNSNEFGNFLQNLPLKNIDEKVLYFDGKVKDKPWVYNGVINLPIGNKDLHQCADATMRLRADYLYKNKMYDKISYNFISDGKPRTYLDFALGDYSEEIYWKYLEYIFSYANTASLKDQLKTVDKSELKIGDILIQKGNPYGHAVIIVDIVNNGNKKLALLAQSYMPAQQLQILNNPKSKDKSP